MAYFSGCFNLVDNDNLHNRLSRHDIDNKVQPKNRLIDAITKSIANHLTISRFLFYSAVLSSKAVIFSYLYTSTRRAPSILQCMTDQGTIPTSFQA